MKKEININGMSCGHCVKHVTNALNEVEGITQVNVELETNKAIIEAAESVTDEQIIAAIDDAGYEVVSITAV